MIKIKILISGGSGFFGRAVTNALSKEPAFQVNSYSHDVLDITRLESIKKIVEEFNPQVIVNCSGVTGNANCAKNPELARAVNVQGVANLASECKKTGILLIHPSSVVVFSGIKGNYKENDLPEPQKGNLYAETKFESEQAVKNSGADFIIPRLSTGYGPINTKDTTNFVGIVVEALKKGEVKKYFRDQLANPVEINDVAKAFGQLIQTNFRGIIHLGGPDIISMYDFAKIIQKEFGLTGEIGESSVAGTNYPPNITLNTSLAQSMNISCKGVIEGVKYCKLLS